MTAAALSNFLADLAERAGDAFRRGRARTIEAAGAYLDCGRLLAEAKAECGHGQWLPFLDRAGIPARTASRMMRLAASGIAAETLAERGIRAASEALARPEKSATVADLPASPPAPATVPGHDPAPAMTPAERLRAKRQANRARGLCACGRMPLEGRNSAAGAPTAPRERTRSAKAAPLSARGWQRCPPGFGRRRPPVEACA